MIHEKVRPAIQRVAALEGRGVSPAPLRLDHMGYVGDQERKHRRNLPMLRAELAARPETIFNWRHLGVALAGTGHADEAERALEHAVELARSAHPDDVHGSLAFAELVRLRHRRGDEVTTLVQEGLERWPEQWLLVWMRARLAVDAGRYEAALGDLDRLVSADVAKVEETGVAYDIRLFGVFAHSARGRCLLALERPAEAARAYAAAERCEPHEHGHRVRRQWAEAAARKRPPRTAPAGLAAR
jgi:tetratricopeptide (TPR) repeat protein